MIVGHQCVLWLLGSGQGINLDIQVGVSSDYPGRPQGHAHDQSSKAAQTD